MTFSNLAVVFGPNLIRSRDEMATLSRIGAINFYTEYLFHIILLQRVEYSMGTIYVE